MFEGLPVSLATWTLLYFQLGHAVWCRGVRARLRRVCASPANLHPVRSPGVRCTSSPVPPQATLQNMVAYPTLDHADPVPAGLRVCSLLPSATDILSKLGLLPQVVCVTHCCDAADEAQQLQQQVECGTTKRVTSSWIKPNTMSQADIDAMVTGTFKAGDPLYGIDAVALAAQRPTLVITQDLCDVCAPNSAQAKAACQAYPAQNGASMQKGGNGARAAWHLHMWRGAPTCACCCTQSAACCCTRSVGAMLQQRPCTAPTRLVRQKPTMTHCQPCALDTEQDRACPSHCHQGQ